MNPNHRPIIQMDACVSDQREVAEESFVLSLEAPQIARDIQPGQFIQIRCAHKDDPLLPRPFSIYRVRGKRFLDILYEVVGSGTKLLAEAKKGESLNIFGPLGNPFTYPDQRANSFLVGGGVGLAPFYDLAEALIDPERGKQKKEDVVVLLGARTNQKIFCEKDFQELGIRFEVATDDGSYGFNGLVTELLKKELSARNGRSASAPAHLYACGPKPMLHAVSQISEKLKLPCEVSIDAHMPCGYGICFGCAVRCNSSYRLACTDGPIFKAEELVWDR